jgi:fluoride exporter
MPTATIPITEEVGFECISPPTRWPPRRLTYSTMAAIPFLSVFIGAGLGACLRWWLSLRLNPVIPALPLGTLASNLIGGYVIGLAVAYFAIRTDLPPETRLFVITGFLGGLTTFSTFSAEVVSLLGEAQYGWALATIGAHMLGSFAATAFGILTIRAVLRGSG